jgi:hypothetical protein
MLYARDFQEAISPVQLEHLLKLGYCKYLTVEANQLVNEEPLTLCVGYWK